MKRYFRVLVAVGAALMVGAVFAAFMLIFQPGGSSTEGEPTEQAEDYVKQNRDSEVVYLNDNNEWVVVNEDSTETAPVVEVDSEDEQPVVNISVRSPLYEAVLNVAGDVIEIFDITQPGSEAVQVYDFSEFTPRVVEFGERYVIQMSWVTQNSLAFSSPAYDETSSQVYVLEVGQDEPVMQLDQNLQFMNSVVYVDGEYIGCHYSTVGFRCYSTATDGYVYEQPEAVFGGVAQNNNDVLFWSQNSSKFAVSDGTDEILSLDITDSVHFFMPWEGENFIGTDAGIFVIEDSELVEVVEYREDTEAFIDSVRLNFDRGVVTQQHAVVDGDAAVSSIFSFSSQNLTWLNSAVVTVW